MKNVIRIFRQPEFHILLFCLFFCLFNWPILNIFQKKPGELLFTYIYVTWGFCIVLLFYVAECLKAEDAGKGEDSTKEE